MKKLPIKIPKNQIVKKVREIISKKVLENSGTILTGSTIVCNAVGIAVTYKNSPKIHEAIAITKERLSQALTEDEKKRISKEGLVEIGKLVAPIIIFFAGSTTCAIVNQKKNEAKIATLTAALSLAQNTISEYDLFKEEVREKIGDEKYEEIQKDIAVKEVSRQVQGQLFTPKPGEEAVWFPYIGKFFSSTEDRIDMVFQNVNGVLRRNGIDGESFGQQSFRGNEIVLLSDICEALEIPHDDIPGFADEVGYEAGAVTDIRYYVGSAKLYGKSYLALVLDTTPSTMY